MTAATQDLPEPGPQEPQTGGKSGGTTTKQKLLIAVTAVLTALTIGLFAFAQGQAAGPVTLEIPERQTGEPYRAKAEPYYLTDEQVEERIVWYLALNAWAENTHRTALDNPANFTKMLLAEPSIQCAQQYRIRRLANSSGDTETGSAEAIGEEEMERMLDCASQQAQVMSLQLTEWRDMSPEHRQVEARTKLRLFWEAINPETMIRTQYAMQQALDVTRSADPQFREYAEEYDECAAAGEFAAGALGESLEPEALSQTWQNAEQVMIQCSNEVTMRLFPSNPDPELPFNLEIQGTTAKETEIER